MWLFMIYIVRVQMLTFLSGEAASSSFVIIESQIMYSWDLFFPDHICCYCGLIDSICFL